MTRHVFLAVCLASIGVFGGVAEAADKPQPLTLKAPSFISATGGDVIIRMRVEPDARSRELTLEWEAEDLSGGSHAVMLDGARAAATHSFALKRLMAGEHLVTAILKLSDGSEIRRTATVLVVGAGGAGLPAIGSAEGAASGESPYPSR